MRFVNGTRPASVDRLNLAALSPHACMSLSLSLSVLVRARVQGTRIIPLQIGTAARYIGDHVAPCARVVILSSYLSLSRTCIRFQQLPVVVIVRAMISIEAPVCLRSILESPACARARARAGSLRGNVRFVVRRIAQLSLWECQYN